MRTPTVTEFRRMPPAQQEHILRTSALNDLIAAWFPEARDAISASHRHAAMDLLDTVLVRRGILPQAPERPSERAMRKSAGR